VPRRPITWRALDRLRLRYAGDSWQLDFNLTGARIIDLHSDGTVGTDIVTC
jgi:hypothetical protein